MDDKVVALDSGSAVVLGLCGKTHKVGKNHENAAAYSSAIEQHVFDTRGCILVMCDPSMNEL